MSELAGFLVGLSLGFGLCWWRLEYWRNRAIWAETLESMRVWADQERKLEIANRVPFVLRGVNQRN